MKLSRSIYIGNLIANRVGQIVRSDEFTPPPEIRGTNINALHQLETWGFVIRMAADAPNTHGGVPVAKFKVIAEFTGKPKVHNAKRDRGGFLSLFPKAAPIPKGAKVVVHKWMEDDEEEGADERMAA